MKRAILAGVFAFAAAILTIPAMTAQAAPPLETYGKLPTTEQVEISPDGARIAYVGTYKGERSLMVEELGGRLLVAQALGAYLDIAGLEWAGGDNLLVKTRHSEANARGGGQIDFVSVDVRTNKSIRIGPASEIMLDLSRFYGVRKIDGRWYGLFAANIVDSHPLYRVDLETGVSTKISDPRADGGTWVVRPDGTIAAYSHYDLMFKRWRVLGPSSNVIFSRDDPLGRAALKGLGRTPDTLVVGPPGGEEDEYLEIDAKGRGKPQPLATPPFLRTLIFDQNTYQLIGYAFGRDEAKIELFDPKLQAKVRAAMNAFPGRHPVLTSMSADLSRMIVFTSSNEDAGSYWLVDLTTKMASPVGVRYPMEATDIGPVSVFDYKAADGLEVHGILTLPPGKVAKGLPLVVLPRGGPDGRDYPGFNWIAQAFASRGYAVLQPNFRGSSGYGDQYLAAGNGEMGGKMQTDLSDGVSTLAAEGIIDRMRTCIVGAFYGGYAALAGVTLQHGVYRCAVSFSAITDPASIVGPVRSWSGSDKRWMQYFGATSETDPKLKAASPLAHAAEADGPILLITSKGDVVGQQNQALARAVEAAGKSINTVELSGEDRSLSQETTRTEFLKAAVAFVEKHNPPN